MIEFWLDTDSLVTPSRGPYRFGFGTNLWDFLQQKADEQVIGSSRLVLSELTGNDELARWAKRQSSLFVVPDQHVQEAFKQIADAVNNNSRYAAHHIQAFLGKADPWIIAHAKASGGRVVTFEKPEPASTKPKIPDVAGQFDVKCISLWDMLSELGFKL